MAGGGASKLYFILYLAVVLELLLVIVDRDDAEDSILKKNEETVKAFKDLLNNLAQKPGTSAQQDVMKYYVNAKPDGSYPQNELDTVEITLKGVKSPSLILNYPRVDSIHYIARKGKDALTPETDSIIQKKFRYKEGASLPSNLISFDSSRVDSTSGRSLKLFMSIKLKNTGYYKIEATSKLRKIEFIPNKEHPEQIRLGSMTVDFKDLNTTVENLESQWNNIRDTIYFAIVNKTIPKPKEPPPVQIVPK